MIFKIINFFKNKKKGFVLLLSLIIVSITLVFGVGAANIIIGQVGISGIARDSKYAFFAAHSGAECALYGDVINNIFSTSTSGTLTCAGQNFTVGGSSVSSFSINFTDGSCANVTVTKPGPLSSATNIKSRGHNKCPVNPATVERGIEVDLNL
ncbi:MAG: hypothetical protein COU46_03590 [Candidatus Niyogibacteria bacterium CG10_big_fil_rev_8_21_14_0_10_42_19]|uniref:Type 4 fimbrial biogenesis protein PilX N-terminal domain-containing protein n=1 Tax=Candidatus Niyogibacteria bacterium CG10_big_fil_rev_8_21_14_0_10_42_19 TaxID=1974725 RepID=A0A2H0TES0_9BACT|nr:MAG: hypothetical protein COU46_03590 [Candidatus Niyogibacteria bacterium CG10_big_fil_rev_8_21_14_0_10_42_19]